MRKREEILEQYTEMTKMLMIVIESDNFFLAKEVKTQEETQRNPASSSSSRS